MNADGNGHHALVQSTQESLPHVVFSKLRNLETKVLRAMPTLTENQNESRPRLSLLTWNIWFARFQAKRRMEAILTWIEDYRPDIVAFQEVTRDLLQYLEVPDSILVRDYKKIDSDAERLTHYWECLYTRLELEPDSGRRVYSQSEMGRGCTILHNKSASLAVGTTHLESLDSARKRELQATEARGWLEALPVRNRFLLGDMNLHSQQTLSHILVPPWQDTWATFHPGDEGLTWDPERNLNIGGGPRERLDRIFMASQDYEPVRMEMVGTRPVSENMPDVFPSDHFGLYLELARRPAKERSEPADAERSGPADAERSEPADEQPTTRTGG